MSLPRSLLLPAASRYGLVLLLVTSAALKIHFLVLGGDHRPDASHSVYAIVVALEVVFSVLLLTRFAVPTARVLIAGVTGAASVTLFHALYASGTAECHCLGWSKMSIWQTLSLQGLLLFLASVWLLGGHGTGARSMGAARQ